MPDTVGFPRILYFRSQVGKAHINAEIWQGRVTTKTIRREIEALTNLSGLTLAHQDIWRPAT